MVEKYRKDSSTPLVEVVDSYDIFVTHKHGAQGVLDRASHSQLENEFGSYDRMERVADDRSKPEVAIEKILKEGQIQQTKGPEKFGMLLLWLD
jgi:ribosome maturation protein Sdo1